MITVDIQFIDSSDSKDCKDLKEVADFLKSYNDELENLTSIDITIS